MNINFIIGENGVGKSNFLDAIHTLSQGKSFKKYSEGTNITWGSRLGFARVEGEVKGEEVNTTKLAIAYSNASNRNTKKYMINDLATTQRKFTYFFRTTLFTPQSLDIIGGSPDIRRAELDDFLSSIDSYYLSELNEYKSVLRNRNKVLQRLSDGSGSKQELIYWTEKLIELGSSITNSRREILKEFLPVLEYQAGKLFKGELCDLKLDYQSRFTDLEDDADVIHQMKDTIRENINKEIAARRSLYGPHKDDFDLSFKEDRSLKVYGSRGQQRLSALILKLAMWEFSHRKFELKPILLLDDIFSELDQKNSRKLEKIVEELETQVFISATDEMFLSKEFLKKGNRINLLE